MAGLSIHHVHSFAIASHSNEGLEAPILVPNCNPRVKVGKVELFRLPIKRVDVI
jgi:hypothetical protein